MPTPRHDLRSRRTPIGDLTPHPRNARNGDTDTIARSLEVNGQYRPIVAARGGVILAGNHTYAAALELGWSDLSVVHLDLDPDSEDAVRIMLADNRTADLGRYDEAQLLELLKGIEDDLDGSGYVPEDLSLLEETLDALAASALDDIDDGRAPTTGELLDVVDVTVGEPRHKVKHGERWNVGEHLLVVAKLHDEHELWSGDLEGRWFAPYPEPYFTLSDRARETPMLLVQPNPYLAGHLLDKHASAFGDASVSPA
jgi:hypothetical protein